MAMSTSRKHRTLSYVRSFKMPDPSKLLGEALGPEFFDGVWEGGHSDHT